jgi:hypothetical protein
MRIGALELINADSRPVKSWGCSEWMRWHQELEKVYGSRIANDFWMKHWREQGVWDKDYNWCKYSASFDAYFKSKGIELGHLLSDIINSGTRTGENLTRSINFISRPVILLGIAAIFLYNPVKDMIGQWRQKKTT